MKRPKYRDLQFKILEALCTRADAGILSGPSLNRICKAPKSSMSNVLKDAASSGLIERKPWFRNKQKIEITDKGRAEYSKLKERLPTFTLPDSVRVYLNRREPAIKDFFPIQKAFVERGLLYVPNNVCIFGYPCSGKTLIAEMAIAQELNVKGKALYCTPFKALDWQKYNDFRDWFGRIGAKVAVTDGDSPISPMDLSKADVVVATYERVLGAIQTNEEWVESVKLVCADEITLLADQHRGGTIDLLITYFASRPNPPRIITLSSIIGNPIQISEWLQAEVLVENRRPPQTDHREYLVYRKGNKITYLGKDGESIAKELSRTVIEDIIDQNVKNGLCTLIFVGSRLQAQELARGLKKYHEYDEELASRGRAFYENEVSEKTRLTKELLDLVAYGVAFHHAGLQRKVRRFIESLMKQNLLKIIVATTTLSHGIDYSIDSVVVDLPAILNIHELNGYEYINLKGRTGRFGKSKAATVYVLTDEGRAHHEFEKYFLGSTEPILPLSTLADETVATAILAEAENRSIDPHYGLELLSKTLCAKYVRLKIDSLVSQMRRLNRLGFLKKEKQKYVITELGRKVNASRLSPNDAKFVLSIPSDISDEELVRTACNIDLVKRAVRRQKEESSDKVVSQRMTSILMDYINESSIDSIKANHGTYYDDQDIIDLGAYASLSLRKIALLVDDEDLRNRIDTLQERVRYGIRIDLVESKFMKLPSLSTEGRRSVARIIFDSGIKVLISLAKQQADNLAKQSNIAPELAAKIISEATRKVSAQGKATDNRLGTTGQEVQET